jgi:hypothetical protein
MTSAPVLAYSLYVHGDTELACIQMKTTSPFCCSCYEAVASSSEATQF